MARFALASNRGKILATALAVGGAATVAGLGTFGSFTSTTSASASVASGTVQIGLGSAGTAANRLTVAASGLVPGDTVQRAVDLAVNGNQDLSGITLTTTASPSSLLDTDATNGLQMTIDSCAAGWTESGTAPAYTYSCASPVSVLASRPVIGSNLSLAGLGVTAGTTNHLRVTLSFPSAAGNTFQNQSSTVAFAFTGTQRTASAH
jgi:spore coat-associated protein N